MNDFHRNRLLAALSEATFRSLASSFDLVELDLRQQIYAPRQPIEDTYFVLDGVVSLVTGVGDDLVEVATVGNEGFVGVPVFLGAPDSGLEAFCQVPGRAARLSSAALRDALRNGGELQNLLSRYTETLFSQIAQHTACNRLHPVEQRCARWLLMTHDRVGGDEFLLTQQFLGQMLGVRRPAVNAAARSLQEAELIAYSRGRVRIVDRGGLEAAACECYRIVRDDYRRLLG